MNQRRLKKNSGQMTLEMMLLMTIFIAGALFVFKEMQSRKLIAGLVEGPWVPLKSMIEDGEWVGRGSKEIHPNLISRHGSYLGDIAP